jgi:hypothetical protein
MTPKEINDLKRSHNALMKQGHDAYDIVLELHEKVMALRKQIEAEEGDDYDGIPLIFGDGFWIDPELP